MATTSIKDKAKKHAKAARKSGAQGPAKKSKKSPPAKPAKAKDVTKPAGSGGAAGMSKTTRDQLVGIVTEHDEKTMEFEKAKARVAELKGSLAATVQEIHSTVKELDGDEDPKGERKKKLIGLEKDRERVSVRLSDAEETKTGLKETIKGCRAELFDVIRGMAKGELLFEQGKEPPKAGTICRYTNKGGKIVCVVKVVASGEQNGTFEIMERIKDGDTKDPPAIGTRITAPWTIGTFEPLKDWKPKADATGPQKGAGTTSAPGSSTAPPSVDRPHWAGLSLLFLNKHGVPVSAVDAIHAAGFNTLGDLEDRKIGPDGAKGRLTLIKGISPAAEAKIEAAMVELMKPAEIAAS